MISLVGICVLLFAAVLLRGELCSYRRLRLYACEELYRFILHMRNQVSCFLTPPSGLCDNFESSLLSECGFLEKIKEGKSINAAFCESGLKEKMTHEEGRVLTELFSGVGSGYLEEEIKHIDVQSAQFLSLLEKERSSTERDVKLIGTLTTTLTLGAVILVI